MSAGKRSDPAKIAREQAQIRRDIAARKEKARRDKEARENLDNRRPPAVSPPAGRTISTWRNRKPIVKGGAVIGRRTPPNTA